MKKILVLLVAVITSATSAFAQFAYESSNPDIAFQFERCTVVGDKAAITLKAVNNGITDVTLSLYTKEAYDDEANIYTNYTSKLFNVIDFTGNPSPTLTFNLPSETSVRFTLIVTGVSRAATEFVRLNIDDAYNNGYFKIKHVPITR